MTVKDLDDKNRPSTQPDFLGWGLSANPLQVTLLDANDLAVEADIEITPAVPLGSYRIRIDKPADKDALVARKIRLVASDKGENRTTQTIEKEILIDNSKPVVNILGDQAGEPDTALFNQLNNRKVTIFFTVTDPEASAIDENKFEVAYKDEPGGAGKAVKDVAISAVTETGMANTYQVTLTLKKENISRKGWLTVSATDEFGNTGSDVSKKAISLDDLVPEVIFDIPQNWTDETSVPISVTVKTAEVEVMEEHIIRLEATGLTFARTADEPVIVPANGTQPRSITVNYLATLDANVSTVNSKVTAVIEIPYSTPVEYEANSGTDTVKIDRGTPFISVQDDPFNPYSEWSEGSKTLTINAYDILPAENADSHRAFARRTLH